MCVCTENIDSVSVLTLGNKRRAAPPEAQLWLISFIGLVQVTVRSCLP